MVIGLSGGVDSMLTAALARVVVDRLGGIKLIGKCLGIESNPDAISRAMAVGESFCDECTFSALDAGFQAYVREVWPKYDLHFRRDMPLTFEELIRRGNIKARFRMMYLFDMAHESRGIVVSTDNFTEYLLGFWTLHGDVGNFGPLQFLWKSEVYGLSGYVRDMYAQLNETRIVQTIQSCIDAVPTDDLGITESDLDQLGAPTYGDVDRMLIAFMHNKDVDENHPVIKRHLSSEFKRKDPVFIPRNVAVIGCTR